MSNVLRVLGGLATAAGKGFEGYGIDKRNQVAALLAEKKAQREIESDRIAGLLNTSQINEKNARATALLKPEAPKAITRVKVKQQDGSLAFVDPNDPESYKGVREYIAPREPRQEGETPAQKAAAIRGAESKVGGLRREFQGVLNRRPRQSQFTDPLTREPDTTAFNEAMPNFRADSTETAGSLKAAQDELAGLRGNGGAPTSPASDIGAPPSAQPVIPSDGFATLAQQYKAALARNVDPEVARKIYEENVAALSRNSGMMK